MRAVLRCVIIPFSSLEANKLGAEGGKAIADALKVNTSITIIK